MESKDLPETDVLEKLERDDASMTDLIQAVEDDRRKMPGACGSTMAIHGS